MTATASPLLGAAGALEPATVRQVAEHHVDVRSAGGDERALNALPSYVPRRGDRVLLGHDASGAAYVVGVLQALRGVPSFTLSTEGDVTRLRAKGELELSGTTVRVRADDEVTVEAPRVRVVADDATLDAGLLEAKARDLHLWAEGVTVVAARLDSRIERARRVLKRLETEADEIIERAGASYREVDGLAQTRAGRVRLIARTSLHMLAERAKLKARGMFAIDGESIHIG